MQTTTRQKFVRYGFWGLLFYVAVTSTIVIALQFQLLPVPEKSLAKNEPTAESKDPVDLSSEQSFAKVFAREYLSWTTDLKSNRAARLKPFWKEGIDVQGNLNFENTQWDSDALNVEVWDMKERPGDKPIKEITLYVETYLTEIDGDEQKRVDRYLVVPIQKAGDSYRVVDVPRFIPPPIASQLPKDQTDQTEGERASTSVTNEVESFVQSFWNSYTTDQPQEIGRLMKNSQPIAGLTGIMSFVESKKVDVFKEEQDFRAEVDVVLEDLATGTQVTYAYTMKVTKENNQWFVVELKQREG